MTVLPPKNTEGRPISKLTGLASAGRVAVSQKLRIAFASSSKTSKTVSSFVMESRS